LVGSLAVDCICVHPPAVGSIDKSKIPKVS
jgi:hypothetical protein